MKICQETDRIKRPKTLIMLIKPNHKMIIIFDKNDKPVAYNNGLIWTEYCNELYNYL